MSFGNLRKQLKEQLTIASKNIKYPKRYPDIVYTVELTQEECFYGCRKEIIVEGIRGDPTISDISSLGCPGARIPEAHQVEKLELKKYVLDISSGVKENDVLTFKGEGCQPIIETDNPAPGLPDIAGNLVFKIKIIESNHPRGDSSPSEQNDDKISYVKINGYDVEVEVKVDILKIIFGGYFKVRYFKEEFEIHTSDFPDDVIEEGKEYKLSELGSQKEDGSRGILTLKIKYDYEEVKKITQNKKEKIKDILEN
jgi:DnaJ-class molecular chaperone